MTMADEYVPLTPAQAEKRMREVGGRLLKAIDEHGRATEAEAAATAEYERVYLTAHLRSQDEHPDWRVGHHESFAKNEAMDARKEMLAAKAVRRALAEEMHTLRQLLSSLQTNARVMGHMTGEAR